MYIYHNFLVHSSVDGHLGCFHGLASAAVNTGVHASLSILVSLGVCPTVGLLGHMVALFLVFKGISIPSSIVAVSIYIRDPADVGNLISGSSAFSKTSFNIWNFMVHVLLKPGLENFEHYFTSM